ncbi:MAG: hypothetical protein M3Z13_05195 [Candidatus Dormibacteraeota bacterium]|nr:hypothetical protein [Candidatus Dormibacteraeota bacterium]
MASGGQTAWTNYQVSADVRTNPTNGHAHIIARHQSDSYFYACGLDHGEGSSGAQLFLGKVYNGSPYTFGTTPYSFDSTTWYHIEFAVQGDDLYCQVTDPVTKRTAILHDVETYFPAGGIGATGEHAEFDSFVVNRLP